MKHVGIIVLSLISFVLPISLFAAFPAFYAFGGRITHIRVCDEGILFSVIGPRPGVFIRTPISRFFPTVIVPVTHVIGNSATVPIPCTISGVPTGEAGLPIIIGGTALTPGI